MWCVPAAMALSFEAGLPEAHPAITSIMMKMAAAHRDKVRTHTHTHARNVVDVERFKAGETRQAWC